MCTCVCRSMSTERYERKKVLTASCARNSCHTLLVPQRTRVTSDPGISREEFESSVDAHILSLFSFCKVLKAGKLYIVS